YAQSLVVASSTDGDGVSVEHVTGRHWKGISCDHSGEVQRPVIRQPQTATFEVRRIIPAIVCQMGGHQTDEPHWRLVPGSRAPHDRGIHATREDIHFCTKIPPLS